MVLGDDPRHVFPVKVATIESVGALREAIKDKKKNVFQHVDADALVLWKVSIPVDRNLKGEINNLELPDEESLSPVEELSEIFSGVPIRKHLHIIVRSPPTSESQMLRLSSSITRCYRVSYYSKHVFPTAIS